MKRKTISPRMLPVLQPRNYAASPGCQAAPEVANKKRVEIRNAADSKSGNPEILIYDQIVPSSSFAWLFGMGVSVKDVMEALSEIGDADEIDVRIDSPGGSMFEGIAIYNALVRNSATINVHVDALAASAASFIAQAGDTVTMSKGSMMMIHDASAEVYGNADDMTETADLLNKSSDNIADLYASRAGGTKESWRAAMKKETWYGAQEAVDEGLADSVAGEAIEDPTNKWDLSQFNYAGRGKAPSPTMMATKEPTVGDDKTPAFSMQLNGKTYTDPTEFQNAVNEMAAKQTPPAPAPAAAPAFEMKIGDKTYTDPQEFQNAVASLQNFQAETKVQARKDFVNKLASDNKILASQIGKDGEPGLEAFALSLPDEQFTAWCKTWDAAPKNALLSSHGGQQNPTTGDAPKGTALENQIEVHKGTLKQHRISGMPEDKLKNTASYKFLEQHNAL